MSKLTTIKLLFILLLPFASSSQDSLVVVSTSETNLLHRNVPNLIKVAFAKMNEPYFVECLGCDITNKDTLGNNLPRHQFLVTPGRSRIVYLDLWTSSDTSNRVKIARLEFLNRDLPAPSLIVGGTRPGGHVSRTEDGIFAKYPPEMLLDNRFEILKWTLKIKRKRFSGVGSKLTPEVLEYYKKIKEETKIEIEAETIGQDNKVRKVEAFFYLYPVKWRGNHTF